MAEEYEYQDYDDNEDDYCMECNHVLYRCTCYCDNCGERVDYDCLCHVVPEELRLPSGA